MNNNHGMMLSSTEFLICGDNPGWGCSRTELNDVGGVRATFFFGCSGQDATLCKQSNESFDLREVANQAIEKFLSEHLQFQGIQYFELVNGEFVALSDVPAWSKFDCSGTPLN